MSWLEYRIALNTTVYVWGRSLGSETVDTRRVDLVEVLKSTDPVLPAVIRVEFGGNTCSDWYGEGGDHFLALSGSGDTFSPPDYAQNAIWGLPDDAPEGAADTEWAWLCDVRWLVDQDGALPDVRRDAWLEKLYTGSVRESRMALILLEQLSAPNIDPAALTASVSRHFEALSDAEDRRHGEFEFLNLYQAAAQSIARSGNGEAAKVLANLYFTDRTTTHMLAANDTDCLVVPLLLTPPNEHNVERLAALLGTRLESRRLLVASIAQTPGEPVGELLWRMLESPGVYGITDSWPLEEVWSGLAARNDPRLRAYLRARVLDPEVPDVGVKLSSRIEDLKQTALRLYHAIPTPEEE